MNADRTQAYGRVVRTLEDLGPAKLLDAEQARIREAADILIFASGEDSGIREAIADVRSLADHLAESGRWTGERADQLVDDIAGCGPLPVLA